MSVFQKVIGKQCLKPKDQCPQSGVAKDPSAFLCESCGSELAPITKINSTAIAAVAAGVLVLGGGVAALRGGIPNPFSGSGGPGAKELAVRYALEGKDAGQLPAGHVFHNGDRFRILMKAGGDTRDLYVFYEDRQNDRMQLLYPQNGRGAELADTATAPAGGDRWIEMDNHSGVEHFVLLAASQPLSELPLDSETVSSSEFASALDRIRKGQGLTEGKSTRDSEWAESKARGSGALLVKLEVEHQ